MKLNLPRKAMLAAVAAAFAAAAHADREVFRIHHPAYQAECGSCHIAYPPQLLPKASWRALMTGLSTHFGTDASLDGKTAKEIQGYLEANAGGTRADTGQAPLRITDTRWFRREHDEVPAALWKITAVKSPANCAACHTQAERGDFSKRNLRMPR